MRCSRSPRRRIVLVLLLATTHAFVNVGGPRARFRVDPRLSSWKVGGGFGRWDKNGTSTTVPPAEATLDSDANANTDDTDTASIQLPLDRRILDQSGSEFQSSPEGGEEGDDPEEGDANPIVRSLEELTRANRANFWPSAKLEWPSEVPQVSTAAEAEGAAGSGTRSRRICQSRHARDKTLTADRRPPTADRRPSPPPPRPPPPPPPTVALRDGNVQVL
mmetsp:Transcript_108600/g.315864  ORF Transcript_108600/g.315864 Transcript_108600/m.315864 type:complete len:219 (-) Transcript_108600:440-1096(-)